MTAAAPRRKLPSWAPQALGYCLSAACLAWVLHHYPVRPADPGHPLARLVVGDGGGAVRSLGLRGARYGVGTPAGAGGEAQLWRTVQSIYIGLFANEVLPLRVGELIRCYLLAHWNGLNLSVAFASAAVERLIDGFWMLTAFLITTIFVKEDPRGPHHPGATTGRIGAGRRRDCWPGW
jgi:glycosyltransferase 2 family protein